MLPLPETFIGVDVQVRRGCPYYAIDAAGTHLASGWLPDPAAAPAELRAVVTRLSGNDPARVAIGIDAPRLPLPSRRLWSWNGSAARWSIAPDAKGAGRHCEVVISALKLANPQWTPVANDPDGTDLPDWMRLGFALFAELATLPGLTHPHEVFPSAAYRQLEHTPEAALTISFAGFTRGPKDMLDAALSALVVREFTMGRGCEVGGGDGFGTIILPRPIAASPTALHQWPHPPRP